MKKNSKINKIIVLSVIGLIMLITLIIFILNYTKDDTSFSLLEKGWINNNSNNIIDISVYNDIPIYGKNGEGIVFSYLEEFKNKYGISFNMIPYTENNKDNLKNTSFRILNYNEELSDNDILIYNDTYVIISKSEKVVDNINDLTKTKMGVLDNDLSDVRYYMNDPDITFIAGKDIDELFEKVTSEEIEYIILPKTMYIDKVLDNDYKIIYHLGEMYKKYVITVKNDNTFKSILRKYWKIFSKENYNDTYKKIYLEFLFSSLSISESERMNYNGNSYTYGYVINMPYENTINKEFVGIYSNYLSNFGELADIDFKIVGYKNYAELKQALSHGEVDMVFGNFNTNGINSDILKTVSPYSERYVVLSTKDMIVNSIRSLKDNDVYTVNDTYLYDYLKNNKIKINGYKSSDELLRNIHDDSVVVIPYDTYFYYRNSKFKEFKIVYENVLNKDYTFVIRDVSKNRTFYKLFNQYVNDLDYKTIKYAYNTDYVISMVNGFNGIVKYAVIICGFAFITLAGFIVIKLKKKNKTEITKEDKLKYTDVMTSLKNRNYLNYNMASWDDNVIYPQCIVIIDLNNIKYINDNYGHTEGDEVIIKAANILMMNQKENTDIIRTDGNEFLIYMVGYDEKKVIEYTRTINKSLKELPHGFGATIGYSMITDDVKTIDDAINEATLSMRQAKEKI